NVNPPDPSTHQTPQKRNLAVTGVMLVIFLFAIDATIVSTAMPTIVARLGGLELYSWVFSIYMLTSALTTPLFGKLSDLFSRRRLMLIGIGIFVLGSTLCGAAQSMEMLVLFRAVQGLGGGAIYALSFILVGILFPPETRARMQGFISSVWGLASVILFVVLVIGRGAEQPMIQLDLFPLSLFRTSTCVATLESMGVFGAVTYLPLYLQDVIGLSASRAGMVLLLLSLDWTAGSLLAGQAINRRGYRFVSTTGMVLMALGYGLFVIHKSNVGLPSVLISAISIGVGMGFANLATLVAAQTGVWFQRIGVATSTLMLFRTFGGAFSVSLLGTVLVN